MYDFLCQARSARGNFLDFMLISLETTRLLLKPVLESDLYALYGIIINPYVTEYLFDTEILPLEPVQKMIAESQKLFAEEKFGLWFIQTKNQQEIIGFVGLWYFFDEEQPQLVYALLPEATKNGYATEAASRILEYAFKDLDFHYLVASCDRPNVSSRKVAERIGMKEVEQRLIDHKPVVFFKAIRS